MLISSLDAYSGKSAVSIALGLLLTKEGCKVGYFKPIGIGRYVGNELVEEDVVTVSQILKLEDRLSDVCPIILDKPYLEFVLSSDPLKLKKKVIEAYERVKEGKDVVIVEGSIHYEMGRLIGLCDEEISSMLEMDVLMVVRYTDDYVIDRLLSAKLRFGERLKFVLFNQVYGYKTSYLKSLAENVLKKRGLEVVGMIPKDPLLAGTFLSEIVEILNGKYLVEPREDFIIEQLLIGAMSPQSALGYFRRAENCAVITGGDRADLITLALEVPNVKCLILTGNLEPPSIITGMAETKGVPIVLVPYDTLTTVGLIERVFGKGRVRGKKKVKRVLELFESHVDVEKLINYLLKK